MSKPAIIRAEFTDYRPVKTRKTVILSFEIPAEEQGAAFAALGYPVMGTSIWVAIAKLVEGASAPDVPVEDEVFDQSGLPTAAEVRGIIPAPVVKAETKRSSRAFLMCQDAEFQIWLAEKYPKIWDRHYYVEIGIEELGIDTDKSRAAADYTLKEVLDIKSKTEMDNDKNAAAAWEKLLASFDYRNQVRA